MQKYDMQDLYENYSYLEWTSSLKALFIYHYITYLILNKQNFPYYFHCVRIKLGMRDAGIQVFWDQ